ncbi:MAG: hypothetical protein ACFHVJ_13820 [Aestuariibacter sp.]
MKKITEAMPYLANLLALDVFIFFALFFAHSLLFKGFPIMESAAKGGAEVFWRVISLQIFIQVALLVALAHFSLHRGLPYVLLATVLSLVLAISIVYSPSHLSKLLTLPSKDELGESFALILSIVLAWTFLKVSK